MQITYFPDGTSKKQEEFPSYEELKKFAQEAPVLQKRMTVEFQKQLVDFVGQQLDLDPESNEVEGLVTELLIAARTKKGEVGAIRKQYGLSVEVER